jgi:hypothetical protein
VGKWPRLYQQENDGEVAIMTAKEFVLNMYPEIRIARGESIAHPKGFIVGHVKNGKLDTKRYFTGQTSDTPEGVWEIAKLDILKKMVRKLES